MVRPRLVEEGVAVGSGTNEDAVDDHSMEDGSDSQAEASVPLHHSSAALFQAPQKPIAEPKKLQSSLQIATTNKGKGHWQRPKRMHATHLVIGCETPKSNSGRRHDHPIHPQVPSSMMHATHFQINDRKDPQFAQGDLGQQQGHSLPLITTHQQDGTHLHEGVKMLTDFHMGDHSATHCATERQQLIAASYPGFQSAPIQQQLYQQSDPSHPQPCHPPQHAPLPHHAQCAGPPAVRTHIEIGADDRPTERMEGVESHAVKPPLVVLDGANIAYAYALAASQGLLQAPSKGSSSAVKYSNSQTQPNLKGVHVASQYFQNAGMRVVVVLPQSWLRTRTAIAHGSAATAVYQQPVLEGLEHLQQQKDLAVVAAPPTDDDDAYALTIARRESQRPQHSPLPSPHGFVVSNDLFRDAAARDETGLLREWLTQGRNDGTGAGRISFAFCDTGSIDEHGETQLDFVPNPRHPLVEFIETQHRLGLYHQS